MRLNETYYNDIEPFCVEWLEGLIKAGLLSGGDVDGRSIHDIKAEDLAGYQRAHFFAGIGGWEYALRLAGWPKDREVWTGSCPCQPFSQAGRGRGFEDDRHLWPVWYELIKKRLPATIFGEQVASYDGRIWLDRVRADLEALGYAVGSADLCAAGLNAPHIRQRLWWVAHAQRDVKGGAQAKQGWGEDKRERGTVRGNATECSGHCGLDKSSSDGHRGTEAHETKPRSNGQENRLSLGASSGMGNTQGKRRLPSEHGKDASERGKIKVRTTGSWNEYGWAFGLDGKSRRIKPGLMPLAHGIPGRVGRIRAYGNAIVPEVAAIFIRAFMEVLNA